LLPSPSSLWFCYGKEGNNDLLLFGCVAVKKATIASYRRFFFWFCYNEIGNGNKLPSFSSFWLCCNKKNNGSSCRHLFLFGFVTTKQATTTPINSLSWIVTITNSSSKSL
jgi:hypothetical protein